MTFGNIITEFTDPKNVILDTEMLFFCVHCEPSRDAQFGGHFVFEFWAG